MAETVIMNCGVFQVCMANIISVLRCIISMLLSSDQDDIVDRVSCVALH